MVKWIVTPKATLLSAKLLNPGHKLNVIFHLNQICHERFQAGFMIRKISVDRVTRKTQDLHLIKTEVGWSSFGVWYFLHFFANNLFIRNYLSPNRNVWIFKLWFIFTTHMQNFSFRGNAQHELFAIHEQSNTLRQTFWQRHKVSKKRKFTHEFAFSKLHSMASVDKKVYVVWFTMFLRSNDVTNKQIIIKQIQTSSSCKFVSRKPPFSPKKSNLLAI